MTVTPLARDNERVPEIVMIPATQLVADDNIRAKLGDLTELKASIKTEGILEPLLVSWIEPPDGWKGEPGYRVAAGHRRLAAAVALTGWDKTVVPCIVREMTEAQRLAVMLIENIHRADLTPVEEARAFARTIEAGMNKKELAKRLGVKEQLLTERIALLALPADMLAELDKGTMTLASAGEYLKLVDHPRELKEVYKRHGANIRSGGVVEDKLRSIARKAKADELEAELTGKGKRVKRSTSSYSSPEGLTWLEKLGIAGKEATKHSRLKCHVVVIINEQYGTTVSTKPACSDPSSHADPDAKVQVTKQAIENAASGQVRRGLSPEEQAQRDAEAEAEKRQLRFVGQWVSGLKRAEQAELVVDASVDRVNEDVAVALGLEDFPIDENGRVVWNETQRFWREAVGKSTIAKFRIAAVDAALQLMPGNYGDDPDRLAWLLSKGYALDEREATIMAKAEEDKTKRRDRMAELPEPLQQRLVKVHTWLKTQDKELRAEFAEDIAEQLKYTESLEDLTVAIDQVLTIWEEDYMPDEDDELPQGVSQAVVDGVKVMKDELDEEEFHEDDDDSDLKYEGEGVESGQYD